MLIQLPSASKLLLILAPSCNRIPLFSVVEALSEPARSTRHNLDVRCTYFPLVFVDGNVFSTINCRIAWDRELNSF
jgi:hypothetical protein